MAIEAKKSFTDQLEKRLGDFIPANQIAPIMAAVADTLELFSLTEVSPEASGPDDLLGAYLSALTVEGRSQKTIDRYAYIISRFMAYANVPTRQVSVYHLRSYLAAEKARGIADSTLEGYREIFSAYFNWLQRESLIEKNPTTNLGAIKCPKKQKQTYSEVDLERLSQGCTRIRDRAIIHFLSSTGCRISEMVELNRGDVDLDHLECVVHGKGDKERVVFLDAVAAMYIREYLATRSDDNPALFINHCNQRMQPGGIRDMMVKLAGAVGVDHVHPHKFRRTLATDLARRGMPVQEVAAILGHEKLDTTMKYIVQDKDDTKQSYRRYHG